MLKLKTLITYKWYNRLIIILIDDENNEIYNKQLNEFKKESSGLTERKLLVFHIKQNIFKKGLFSTTWQEGKTAYKYLKKTNKSFEIILISLDGDEKLRQNTFLPCETLFSKIDLMPMRINELRKN